MLVRDIAARLEKDGVRALLRRLGPPACRALKPIDIGPRALDSVRALADIEIPRLTYNFEEEACSPEPAERT